MATRSSSSSSSSSSETEITTGRVREISETSRDTTQTGSRLQRDSPTNTIDGTSIADTTTVRSSSPTAVSRNTYDTASIATTTNTRVTGASQQPLVAGGIPIIRPPVFQQQQAGTGIGVFGPQVPGGYPTQPPIAAAGAANQQSIQIDVAAAQQQYQQRAVQPEISPYSGSSTTSSGGSLSSPGTASLQQQPRFDAAKAIFNQADANHDGSISREEFRQWAQGGTSQATGQFQQQQVQAQFANQIPAHEVYNELLGPDAFKDVILDIDYGALGGLNAAFQSGGDFGGQLPPGISIRPAYTTVDSLNYQQHMFNTARTINAGGESNNYDYGGASSNYNYDASSAAYGGATGGQQFDVAKAIFNQADANHDGSISRDEFRQWAQGNTPQNYGGQSYASAANYQTTPANYGNPNNTFLQAGLFAGADPSVANILQQSGLGQVVPN